MGWCGSMVWWSVYFVCFVLWVRSVVRGTAHIGCGVVIVTFTCVANFTVCKRMSASVQLVTLLCRILRSHIYFSYVARSQTARSVTALVGGSKMHSHLECGSY